MRPVRCLKCDELIGVHWQFDERTQRHVRQFVNGCAEPITRCPGCGHDLGHLADCQQLKVLEGKLEVAERGRAA